MHQIVLPDHEQQYNSCLDTQNVLASRHGNNISTYQVITYCTTQMNLGAAEFRGTLDRFASSFAEMPAEMKKKNCHLGRPGEL